VKGVSAYAVAIVATMLVLGLGLSLIFRDAGASQAIVVSGVIALVLQVIAFAMERLVPPMHGIAARGIAMLLRLVVLVVYALVVVKVYGMPPAAALVSLATFFFVCTLIEPWFLKL
jgi:hypothetical protein